MSSPQQPGFAPGQQQAWYPRNRPKRGGHPQPGAPQQFPQQGAYQQQAGYPQAHPQQGGQWHYAQQGYPQVQGKPNDPLRVTTAVLNLAVSAFMAIAGVILAVAFSSSVFTEKFILPATTIWFFGDVLLLVAAGLLIIGAVRLFRSQCAGAPFTVVGGAVGTAAAVMIYVSGYVWEAIAYTAPIIEYVLVYPPSPIIVAIMITGLVPLVLGLLPPLRRSLR